MFVHIKVRELIVAQIILYDSFRMARRNAVEYIKLLGKHLSTHRFMGQTFCCKLNPSPCSLLNVRLDVNNIPCVLD